MSPERRRFRLYQIRWAILVLTNLGIDPTLRNIAKAVGLSPSTHLIGLLQDLESHRYVVVEREPYRNTFRCTYWLTDRGKML